MFLAVANLNEFKFNMLRRKRLSYKLYLIFIVGCSITVFVYMPLLQPENVVIKPTKEVKLKTSTSLENELKQALHKATKKIKILLWYRPYDNRDLSIEDEKSCGKCKLVFNRSAINDQDTKAVIFEYSDLKIDTMPLLNRRNDQYYVWWIMDTPLPTKAFERRELYKYNRVFNLTMTYRWDSDVFYPYGNAQKSYYDLVGVEPLDTQDDRNAFMMKKMRLAVWFVSNCKTNMQTRKRLRYSSSLIYHGLNLERYGKCFAGYIKKKKHFIETAKFYMAFENAEFCKDYITEKFFENALQYGAVPVVMGAKKKDYEALAPPNSFIYAEDYSVEKLVEYLNYLDNNDTAYLEYFKWRQTPPVLKQGIKVQTGFCQLCRILHGINVDNLYNSKYEEKYKHIHLFGFPDQPRIVKSISYWFLKEDNENCLRL